MSQDLKNLTYEDGVVAGQLSMLKALAAGGVGVSNRMLEAAQDSYNENRHPDYGLTDADMRRAIKAALMQLGSK